nr:B12-binding domain-containing protein [Alkalibacter mobilis]
MGGLEKERVLELVGNFTEKDPTVKEIEIIIAACQDGIGMIGERFERGEYSANDLVFANLILSECIEMINSRGFNISI